MLNQSILNGYDQTITVKQRAPICDQAAPRECGDCLTAVVGVLFDGSHIYDIRTMTPDELRRLNAELKRQKRHDLWWEWRTATLDSCGI